jgi:hypothetical protein
MVVLKVVFIRVIQFSEKCIAYSQSFLFPHFGFQGCSSIVGVLVEFSSQYSPFRKLWAHTHLPIKPNYKHGFIEMITWRYHANTLESVARKPLGKMMVKLKASNTMNNNLIAY